jgi:hypothetical protein
MPITLHRESDRTYRLDFGGRLRRTEVAECEARLADELSRVASVKLLCVLRNFEGWERHNDWNDLRFYLKHGDRIARIAIVGDEKWRSEAMMFAAADLRKAPVEFFTEDQMVQARAWLAV